MEIKIYFDIAPWMKQGTNVVTYTDPTYMTKKDENATRYKVAVEVPDPYQVDVEIKGEAIEVTE
jgi:hypothetical protein